MSGSSADDPQSLPTLLHLLVLGTSSNAADLSTSDTQLTAYEAQFHSHANPESRPWTSYVHIALPPPGQPLSHLLPATHQSDAAVAAIRTLAVIRLKHAIEKYWRAGRVVRAPLRQNGNGSGAAAHTAPVRILDDDRAALRSILLHRIVHEAHRGVALQACVCISRIARTDFPNQWPDLLDHSLQALNAAAGACASGNDVEGNTLAVLRSAEVVKRVLKELSLVKVLAGKVRMAELAKRLLPSLLSFFPQIFTAAFPTSTSPDAVYSWATSKPHAAIASLIRVSHLLFKSISILAVADVGTLSARAAADGGDGISNLSFEWFKTTPSYLEHVFSVRASFLDVLSSPTLDQSLARQIQPFAHNLTKHVSAIGKFYLALLDKDKSRATSWSGWSDIVAWYWTKTGQAPASAKEKSRDIDEEALMPFPSTLVIHTLLLLRRSLEAWNAPANRGRPVPSPFDSDDFAVSTAQIVVDYFLPFERSALERWESDPEQWTVEEDQAQEDAASEVRPCAERLLVVLARDSKGRKVGRAIWRKFLESASFDVQDLNQVVRRDAVYTALGRLRDYLPVTESEVEDEDSEQIRDDRIDISKAFVQRLLPEAAQVPPAVSPSWVLIRRRVSWLLYEYSEKLSPASRDAVYRLLSLLLDSQSNLGADIAVRLSAARTLGALVDDIGFDADVFQPYLEGTIRCLAELATDEDLALMDSIALSTRSLSILIERSGPRVAPLVPTLTELAPALWAKESSDECKTRPAVLSFVKSLLRATESTSAADPAQSSRLQLLVAPLVTSCLQPGLAPLLAIDALQLWHRAVRCAAAMQGDLFNLLSVALDVDGRNGGQGPMTETPDYASDVGRVIEEYALWFDGSKGAGGGAGGIAREMVRSYGAGLFASFARIIRDDPMVLYPIQTIDVLVQSMHAGDRLEATGTLQPDAARQTLEGPPTTHQGMNMLAQLLSQTGLFEAIVRGAIALKESSVPCSYYVSLLSRLALCFPPNAFIPLLRTALHAIQTTPGDIDTALLPNLPSIFLSLFTSKFEVTASARRRKLIALGMSALLASARPCIDGGASESAPCRELDLDREVYAKVQEWVGTWLDALADIRERQGGSSGDGVPAILTAASPSLGPSLLEDDDAAFGGAGDDDAGWLEDVSSGAARARHLTEADWAVFLRLSVAVKEALGAAQGAAPVLMQGIWQGMDAMVLDLLNKELGM